MADRTESCPTASHQQQSGAPIAARSCGRVLSVARSHRLIRLADAAAQAPNVVVQSGEPCANQSKYRQWQRASGSHGRVQDSSCGTHNNEYWNGQQTKTINQPLVRNRSKTTLGEVVGKVGILSKPPGRKQTHTLPAQGNRNTGWTFITGQSEEDYIGDLPDRVHSTAFKHKQISKGGSVTYFTPCIYIYMLCSVLCVVCCVVLCCVL